MESVTFVDGHTVTRVHHDVRRVPRNEWNSLGHQDMAGTLND